MAFDESQWGTNAKERHATIEREGVSSTVNRKLRGKRGVVESNDTADKAGVMFWYREGGVDPRRDSQDLGAAVRRCVRKTGRKLLRRTWASARQSPKAALEKSDEFYRSRSGRRISKRRFGLPTRPHWCEWRR